MPIIEKSSTSSQSQSHPHSRLRKPVTTPYPETVVNEPRTTPSTIIIGAGPAGVAAAVTSARHGVPTTLVDKAVFPRDKCCGDGLTALALSELAALGLRPEAVPSWTSIDTARLRSPSGREVDLPLPARRPVAAVAPRRELDAALVDLARSNGVEVLQGTTFCGLEQRPDGVDVTLECEGSRVVRGASWLIAADGMWSPVRKYLGLSPEAYLGEWHAMRQYAHRVTGPARDRLMVWFEEDLLPGYAWSFPLAGDRVNLGYGIIRQPGVRTKYMTRRWNDIVQRPHIREALGHDAVLEDRPTAWPIPARIDEAITGSGRVLFVGDAVGACDVLTGEGIGQALLTGRLAARAVSSHTGSSLDTARMVRRTYNLSVHEHLVTDHRMSLALAAILAHSRGARGSIAIVGRCGPWGRERFARWMFEDQPRAIALTPRRWFRHRHAHHAP